MSCKHIPIQVGTKFGRLTTTSEIGRPLAKGEIHYKCVCSCGSEPRFYSTYHLRGPGKHSRSCGCLRKDKLKLKGRLTLIKKGIGLSDTELKWIADLQKEVKEMI